VLPDRTFDVSPAAPLNQAVSLNRRGCCSHDETDMAEGVYGRLCSTQKHLDVVAAYFRRQFVVYARRKTHWIKLGVTNT